MISAARRLFREPAGGDTSAPRSPPCGGERSTQGEVFYFHSPAGRRNSRRWSAIAQGRSPLAQIQPCRGLAPAARRTIATPPPSANPRHIGAQRYREGAAGRDRLEMERGQPSCRWAPGADSGAIAHGCRLGEHRCLRRPGGPPWRLTAHGRVWRAPFLARGTQSCPPGVDA